MSAKLKSKTFAKYAIAAVAALLIIGVAVTTVMLKAKRKDVVIIEANKKEVENSDSSQLEKRSEKITTAKQTQTGSPKASATVTSISYPIDINKADIALLCTIDGVGNSTAQRILDYREKVGVIHSMNELLSIDGIGAKTLDKLESYLYVSDADKAVSAAVTVTTSATTTKALGTVTKKSSVTSAERTYKQVNINTADAQEISQALLISLERAQKIVDMRIKIHGYKASLEILLSEAISEDEYLKLEQYILI